MAKPFGVWMTYQSWVSSGVGAGDLTGTHAEMEAAIRKWTGGAYSGVRFEVRPYAKDAPPIDDRKCIVEALRNLSPYDYGDSWTTVLSLADMIEGGLGKP